MVYQVVILTSDTVFARMLELEFTSRGLRVLASAMGEDDRTDVVLLDLDSAMSPPAEQYRRMIGFSRHPAMSVSDAGRCTVILRRPFRMAQLRQEVLSELGEYVPPEPMPSFALPDKREIFLSVEDRRLRCDRKSINVSPQECRLLQCLLNHRGETVPREVLAECIGQTDANKTDVYICYLRRKTDALPGGRLIRTVWGKGYQID